MAAPASFGAPPAVAAGSLRFAAGYIRRSDPRKQRDNHSADVQRAAIEQLAAQLGCVVTMWEQEELKGRRIDRSGYQRILEAARRREIHVILVFSLSRWGRRPLERVTQGESLDRLGVELWSAQQGRDKPGFMRYGYAGMDEQSVRDLAANVRPARRRAAESGVHMGPTPQLGYRRHYPAWDGDGKRPAGELVVDEATAWVVRELYARYDGLSGGGNESCATLARWMNTDPRVPAPRDAASWGDYHVRAVLRSVLYTGRVSYDKLPQGYYERAAPGDHIVRPGKHAAIVADDVWRRVQERMDTAGRRPTRARVRHAYLGAGLLVCAGCGAAMRPHVPTTIPNHKGSYLCRTSLRNGDCAAPGYRLDLAHEALLTELRRLRGAPWTTRGEERLRGGGVRAATAVRLKREIVAERAALRDQAEALAAMRGLSGGATKGGGIPSEAVRAFLALSEATEARIAGLEAQHALAERAGPPIEDLRALWTEVRRTDPRAAVEGLDYASDPDDAEPVRRLLLKTVESAKLVERRPATHSRWLRVEVTWTEGVRELLRAGMLTLDPAPEPPVLPTPTELRTAAHRRWRERKGRSDVEEVTA